MIVSCPPFTPFEKVLKVKIKILNCPEKVLQEETDNFMYVMAFGDKYLNVHDDARVFLSAKIFRY